MLEVGGLTVTLHGITILRSVTLTIEPGRIVGLIGRNGAGKTTTLRAIMGLTRAASGRLKLAGEDLSGLPPHLRARLGIGYVPEDRRLISALSARENILVPAWAGGLADAEARLDGVYTLMPELRELAARPAALLSGGQQKLVALARSFMYGSRLLLPGPGGAGVPGAPARPLGPGRRVRGQVGEAPHGQDLLDRARDDGRGGRPRALTALGAGAVTGEAHPGRYAIGGAARLDVSRRTSVRAGPAGSRAPADPGAYPGSAPSRPGSS